MTVPIGELFVLGFSGEAIPEWLRRFAGEHGLGGVILFDLDWRLNSPNRNIISPEQLTELCAELHALPSRPLIMVDQEGGRVRRLKEERGFAPLPSQEEQTGLPAETLKALLETSYRQMKAVGIDYDLAPVVDMKLNPESPDIGAIGRAFSAEAATVRQLVRRQDAVARAIGLGLCLKHYPGLGGAGTDTHKELTDLTDSLNTEQLALFYELGAEVFGGAVMVSHGFVRSWDEAFPASLSPAAIGRLREKLPDALIFSDDLQMGALQNVLPTGPACVQGLRAGLDLLLIGNNLLPEEAQSFEYAALVASAVREDPSLHRRAEESVARVRAKKALFTNK